MKNSREKTIWVKAASGRYGVVCRQGLLREAGPLLEQLGEYSSVHAVSSTKVWSAVGRKARLGVGEKAGARVHLFDDAERAKNLKSVEAITRSLVRAGADRHSLIVAVGGGVVGDVVGFAAASYLRGVDLVQVPTTLVAQVDSAVGGKTGVNLPEGKNLVGAFYPPKLVLVDPQALKTLAEREFRGGIAEVIKYGVIADAKLFAFLETEMARILERRAETLEHIIRTSIEIKARVVSADERESGLREILNFGHTFGHALESITHYRRYQHGEAVAWGMMCAALLGHEAAGMPADAASRVVALVRRMGPLPAWPKAEPGELIAAMRSDKKARGGKLRFVLSSKIGSARTFDGIPEKTVETVLRHAPHLYERPEKIWGRLARG